jgi:transaldolase
MKVNSLLRLKALGQSIWLDDIQRGMLRDGTLARLIEEDGVAGQTSNPAIFEKAITHSADYDTDIAALTRQGLSAEETYETLAIRDVRDAAELFRRVYDATEGGDGFVSLEVSPHLAHETESTVAEARRLWKRLNRPNVMIKVPGTQAGLPAFKALVEEGVNVNVTLLFGLQRYREVAEQYIAGLEARAAQGQSLDGVASVASFFLSRIDTLIDGLLDERIAAGDDGGGLAKLRGQAAVASARIAYTIYKELFSSPRWQRLAEQGARPQRLLWASTSTKDPAYSEVKYVDSLIAPDSVNTMPMATLEAYRGTGKPAIRIDNDLDEAGAVLEALPQAGIDLDEATRRLEDEGVRKFVEPYEKLLATLKRRHLATG